MNSPEMLSMHPYDLVDMFQGGLPVAHPVCCSALILRCVIFVRITKVVLLGTTVSPIHILLRRKLIYSYIGAICFAI